MLKGQKYLFLKNEKNITAKQKIQRDIIRRLTNIRSSIRFKILFDDFWTIKSPQEAQGFLAYWLDVAHEAMIDQFLKFASTVIRHWNGITNYSKYHIFNCIIERSIVKLNWQS